MPRPPAKELTERELEIMHLFWKHGAITATVVRDHLAKQGRDLAYTTVATLVRILVDKGFLKPTNDQRPFTYRSLRSFEEVSRSLLADLLDRVFGGSRRQLLIRLMEEELTVKERDLLEKILKEERS
jgi:predicted transcriptional regulator